MRRKFGPYWVSTESCQSFLSSNLKPYCLIQVSADDQVPTELGQGPGFAARLGEARHHGKALLPALAQLDMALNLKAKVKGVSDSEVQGLRSHMPRGKF